MTTAQIIITSCSRRSLEIEQVKQFLQGNGYTVVEDTWQVASQADLILISTCGFTQAAEDFGFATLRRVQVRKKPEAKILFGGCIPKINPERVQQEFDGPTFSPQSYAQLNEILGAEHKFETFARPHTFTPHNTPSLIRDAQKAMAVLQTFDGSYAGLEYISRRLSNGLRRKLIRHKYANLYSQDTFYLQIQEGCSMHCTYCAIKTAIGPLRSRPVDLILREFENGLNQGYNHFQLMGDNAGSYGLDIGTNLGRLLQGILAFDQRFVLDLTDINPVYLPLIVEPVQELSRKGKLSTLYVPIQSASRRLLKLMGRDCDMTMVQDILQEIRGVAGKKVKIGTSLIVGFPSETMAELDQTTQFCQEVGFDWVWCHSFSTRPESPAAALPDPIPADEILRRVRQVQTSLRGQAIVTTADDAVGSKTCQG